MGSRLVACAARRLAAGWFAGVLAGPGLAPCAARWFAAFWGALRTLCCRCMMCVSGVAPELANCNPGNAARYLGHAECCNVWAGALDLCTAHCPVSAKTRRLAACDKLIIGDKDVDKCDACLELQQAGSSTGSDCQAWKKLVSQCAGPCEEGHKNYASCVVVEAAARAGRPVEGGARFAWYASQREPGGPRPGVGLVCGGQRTTVTPLLTQK